MQTKPNDSADRHGFFQRGEIVWITRRGLTCPAQRFGTVINDANGPRVAVSFHDGGAEFVARTCLMRV